MEQAQLFGGERRMNVVVREATVDDFSFVEELAIESLIYSIPKDRQISNEQLATGTRQSFIHDIAVRRKYWGRYVVQKLVRRAEEVTREHGMQFIAGSIAVHNERAIGVAKALGYEIERVQIIKRV